MEYQVRSIQKYCYFPEVKSCLLVDGFVRWSLDVACFPELYFRQVEFRSCCSVV